MKAEEENRLPRSICSIVAEPKPAKRDMPKLVDRKAPEGISIRYTLLERAARLG